MLLRGEKIVSSRLSVGNGLDESSVDEHQNDARDDVDENHARHENHVEIKPQMRLDPILCGG